MPMNAAKLLLLNVLGGSAADPSASFTAVTSGAQTLTINALTVSAATTVDWGDGSSDVYTGSGARTHNYAGAGTWQVRILEPLNVTTFNVNSTGVPIVLNSADVKGMLNVTDFNANNLPAGSSGTFDSADVSAWRPSNFYLSSMPSGYGGTFDSADVSAWRPTDFRLSSMPSGYGGTFDSADVSAWRPSTFWLSNMPSGYGGTFDSADVSAWRPTNFYLYSMPSGYSFTLSAADFSAWTGVTNSRMDGNALTQAQVDAVLLGLYTAAQSRTVTGGSMNLSGSNAAPSGVYAAECPPTTGLGAKHGLLNDSCGVIDPSETWVSITTTA